MIDDTALTTIVEQERPLEMARSTWLHAKFKKSGSTRTQDAYCQMLDDFRAALQRRGLDLDSDPRDVAEMAQAYASFSRVGKQITGATYNLRLAALSSFYKHAIRRRYLEVNPIAAIERAKVERYAKASAPTQEETRARLARIDRSTKLGKRDYALLRLFLQTGRRLSEIAALTIGDVDGVVVTFQRCKGNKTMSDTLPPSVLGALHDWLRCYYGETWRDLPKETPMWVSLSRQNYGQPLGKQAMSDICEDVIGTSNIHKLRNRFALDMEAAGAKESEIQARLGHESLATTGLYLAKLKQAENAYAEKIAAFYDEEE